MDVGTADKYHFKVGDHVRVLLAGPTRTFTISGLVKFGTADNLAGATLAAFDLPTAQRLFDEVGHFDAIDVLAQPGTDKATLQRAIAKDLPPGVEVVSGQTVANEQTNSINQALGFFSTALLVFAFISLFVGGFTIFNTFSITGRAADARAGAVADRRAPAGARCSARCWLEAGLLGLVASLVGLGLGVLSAVGLEALLKGFGVTLPTGPLVFETRTVIVALVVGIGVTVVSAISPARRAVRIPPVAALVDHQGDREESSRRRIVVGTVIAVLGIAALAIGLTKPAIQLVGVGAVAIFIGIGMLAPIVARPMASVLGRPLARLLGTSGKLGRENSMRSPRRTAQTSSALMVGLALVSTIAVFGASLSKSATSSVDQAVSADYIITSSGSGARRVQQFGGRRRRPYPRGDRGVDGLLRASSNSGGRCRVSPRCPPITCPGRSSSGWIRRIGAPALVRGDLLIDTTTANSDHLVGRFGGAGEVRPDRVDDDAHRWHLQAERPHRQLPRRRRVLPLALQQPAAGGRAPADGRRAGIGRGGRSTPGSPPTRISRSRPWPSSRSRSRPRSTSSSGWCTPSWPWPWSSPSSGSSTRSCSRCSSARTRSASCGRSA